MSLLLQGTVVALQETHWSEVSAAIWGGLFPGASVVASAAPGGDGADPILRLPGGVAIIAPHPFVLSDPRVLCPGYGLSVTVSHPCSADVFHVHNIYLPPDNRLATARLICEALAGSDPAPGLHFMTGDFNTQVGAPRGEVEAEVATLLEAAIARLHIHWTTEHLASRRGRYRTQLDGIAAPFELGGSWQVRDRWAHGLSDHAALVGSLAAPAATTGRRCTPGAIALLPPEAIADLRLGFAALHHAFGVPFSAPEDISFPSPRPHRASQWGPSPHPCRAPARNGNPPIRSRRMRPWRCMAGT